jgi:transcriptional regulator
MSDSPAAPVPDNAAAASPFESFTDGDVADLIAEFPLAWLCAGGGAAVASLLPLLLERDGAGRPIRLIGHMARRNPLFAALQADPRCLILFTGPQAYVSPETVGDLRWGPTWNYAQLRVEGAIDFAISDGDTLAMLVTAMEDGRDRPWRIDDMGPRYHKLAEAIVGFTISIDRLAGRFKLGQDERPETVRRILAAHPDAALVRWMRRFNSDRL